MWPRPKPAEKQRRLGQDGVGVGTPTAFGEGVHKSDFYKPLDREEWLGSKIRYAVLGEVGSFLLRVSSGSADSK